MGAMPNEPSMEEILSSIKRIIADEDRPEPAPRAPRRASSLNASRVAEPESESEVEGESEKESASEDPVLELTEALPDDSASEESAPDRLDNMEEESPVSQPAKADAKPATRSQAPADAGTKEGSTAVLSDLTAEAARKSLSDLSRLLVRDEEGTSNTLEGVVREMLRPMLKDWLDARLPELVETMVKREIDRITGRL